MEPKFAIEIKELHKYYDDIQAVKGVSLNLEAGTVFSLLGPNGAGKSTLISMVSGLLRPTRGEAIIMGNSIAKSPKRAKENLGVVPMAVASGGTRRLVHEQLRQVSIFDWFDTIVTCEDTDRHKPDPDVFLEAADRLKVLPKDCCVYEDGEPGIEAARRAGMTCIDVRRPLP